MLYQVATRLAQATPTTFKPITPKADNIPGSSQVSDVIGGMMGWGLLLAGAALVISAVVWAFGANSQNSQQATAGKRGVLIALAAAIIIGAGNVLVSWAFNLGSSVSL